MKKLMRCFFIVLFWFAIAGCIGNGIYIDNNIGEIDGVINISYNDTKQTIDGFGGSNAWIGLPSNSNAAEEVVKLLYSKTDGMGFTILRNRIPFRERLPGDDDPNLNDGFLVRKSDHTYNYTESAGVKTFSLNWNSWDISNTRNLITRIKNLGNNGPGNQFIIMSTPWTPPNNRVTRWKEDVIGTGIPAHDGVINWSKPDWWGRLKREHYNDYADLLADYVRNFQANMGHPLAILSIQNEPNMKVGYESAYMNGSDIRDFLKAIGQRFPLKGITLGGANGLGIMAPEFENYDINFDAMIKPSLDDPISNNVLTHIALHQYNGGWDPGLTAGTGNGLNYFPKISTSGKRFWQTEIGTLGPRAPTGHGIDNALYFARMIHFDKTMAGTNAFLYWWLWLNVDTDRMEDSLITVYGSKVTAAKRLYAMGQYSRFIRPGWIRIEATSEPVSGIFSSAYKSPSGNEIAIVVINNNTTHKNITLNPGANNFASLRVWRTSADENLALIGNQEIVDGKTNVRLLPRSITTFYGSIGN